ncbi:hypothetical protein SSAG_00486 [Streptomyces sp. Mg1]|nr:hypothetical protein SSAG_00486 [Streptomyces sp. Mg1]
MTAIRTYLPPQPYIPVVRHQPPHPPMSRAGDRGPEAVMTPSSNAGRRYGSP